jgi:hypothetical protein
MVESKCGANFAGIYTILFTIYTGNSDFGVALTWIYGLRRGQLVKDGWVVA